MRSYRKTEFSKYSVHIQNNIRRMQLCTSTRFKCPLIVCRWRYMFSEIYLYIFALRRNVHFAPITSSHKSNHVLFPWRLTLATSTQPLCWHEFKNTEREREKKTNTNWKALTFIVHLYLSSTCSIHFITHISKKKNIKMKSTIIPIVVGRFIASKKCAYTYR